MKVNNIVNADTLETVKTFPDKSINCVITSPPYYQLRDYGYSSQWGLEKTYQEYLDKMISLMFELKRVLKDDGTMWINLGDTYSTTSGNLTQGNLGTNKIQYTGAITGYHKPGTAQKCLMLIPHRFAIRCVDELGLILRNDIIWGKRNGMPESVTDRFSKKHEFIFFFVKQQKYYFDLNAIKKPLADSSVLRLSQNIEMQVGSDRVPGKTNGNMKAVGHRFGGNKGDGIDKSTIYSGNEWEPNPGANPGDVSDFWDIPTQPSSAKHYATFNTDLIDKPIIAGCPKDGVILDPFCGTGTTLLRAYQLGRNYIGIDGSKEYCEIAEKRIKPEKDQTRLAI